MGLPKRDTTMRGESGAALWERVKARLAHKLEALSEEVRAYPSPIARCDDQLPKLLDRRAAAQASLRLAQQQAVAGLSDAQFLALIEELARADDEDQELAALRDAARALAGAKARTGA
jgi:hypothetical protein